MPVSGESQHTFGGVMQISDTELKKVMLLGSLRLAEPIEEAEASPRPGDEPLIRALTQEILEMPDREDRVAELRARIDAGTYNPTSEEIADAMVRRSIADQIR